MSSVEHLKSKGCLIEENSFLSTGITSRRIQLTITSLERIAHEKIGNPRTASRVSVKDHRSIPYEEHKKVGQEKFG